ncbi:WAP-type 'four-disulfide core' domain [Trinorchestia longiramus]|nr:WAP-type 'four-disulfide core' domain [Trinorchestia longiramus]
MVGRCSCRCAADTHYLQPHNLLQPALPDSSIPAVPYEQVDRSKFCIMRMNSVLFLVLLAQIYAVNCQFGHQKESPQNNRRLATGSTAPISVLPEFISRTFGLAGSEEHAKPALRRRSSTAASHSTPIKTIVPAKTRIPGRPYAAGVPQRSGSKPFISASAHRKSNLRNRNTGSLANKRPASGRVKAEDEKPTKRKPVSPSVAVTPPQSLDGWVSHPTEASVAATTKLAPVADKAGQCGSTFSYGIKCAVRMDQCSEHVHCPGDTRCCMVAECGYMCVKPKAKSDGNKKRRGSVSSILRRQSEQDLGSEVSTTAMGLKLDDIALHVEDT